MKGHLPPLPVLLSAVLVPLFCMIPTWQGYHYQQPPDRVFMGFRYMAGDHYQYAALMRQAQYEGRLLMENRYTTEPQKGVYVFLYYWLTGTAARLTGASLIAVWELFRLVGGFLYIVLFWRLTAYYFDDPRQRVATTLVFSFGGGLDWIVTALRASGVSAVKELQYPYDYYWNWSTFGTMLVPNWVWPGLMWILVCTALLSRSRWRGVVAFILSPLIWLTHHHTALVVYLTLGLLSFTPIIRSLARLKPVPWPRVRDNLRIVVPGIASFAVVATYLLWARTDVVFRLNAEASFAWRIFFTVWWYPLSYGLLLPLAWFGMKDLGDVEDRRCDLLFSWLMAAFFLSVNPIVGGAKYQYLMFPPLVVFACRGLYYLKRHSTGVRRALAGRLTAAVLAAALCLDAPVSLVKDARATRSDPEIYTSADEVDAMNWLASQPAGTVLCSYRVGHLIPWLAGKKVYIGHWFMTLDLNRKAAEVDYFYRPQVPTSLKRDILRRTGARYVFFGPTEASMGPLDAALSLKPIYDRGAVRIYEVPSI